MFKLSSSPKANLEKEISSPTWNNTLFVFFTPLGTLQRRAG